ncbi:ABC transporter permease subunit [Ensifer adhaerens]
MDLLQGWGDEIAHGTLLTMKVAVLSLLVGLCWGMLGALAQMSPNRAVASLGRGFSLVMRGTPELLVILIVYFGGTVALTKAVSLFVADFGFVEVPPLQAGVFALSLVFGGYAAEVLRGAWQSVPSGVIEAGHSLGLGGGRHVRQDPSAAAHALCIARPRQQLDFAAQGYLADLDRRFA